MAGGWVPLHCHTGHLLPTQPSGPQDLLVLLGLVPSQKERSLPNLRSRDSEGPKSFSLSSGS